MSSYAVKEMFLTLQGEGVQTGRRAAFLRFAGCNLWSGREEDRETAKCRFCDTDFLGLNGDGGGRFDASTLAARARTLWDTDLDQDASQPFIVATGGEPLLQLDETLIRALKAQDFEIAIETNGTIAAPGGIDWICVSPKAGTDIVQKQGNELKVVFPQPGIDMASVEEWDFQHFLVQPMDNHALGSNREAAIRFVLSHPRWRLSTQTHKVIGIR